MLERLTAFFSNPASHHTPLPEADAQHALGALLVRAAKADDTYLVEEIAQIDKVLCERHGLNPVQAAKMRAECEVLEKAMPNTADITAVLEHAISVEEKEATLTALWRVVYADGINKEVEDRLLHEIEAVLGVGPERAKALQDAAHG